MDNPNTPDKSEKTKILPNAGTFINIYLFIMFTVFPLFVSMYTDGKFPFIHLDEGFVGIRHQKYYFFLNKFLNKPNPFSLINE